MGAYNVLTMAHLTKAGEGNYFGDALAAVRWINEQRNSQGGFVSTQASGRNSVSSSHAEWNGWRYVMVKQKLWRVTAHVQN